MKKGRTKDEDIHRSISRLDPNRTPDISFVKRDSLIEFNTDAFWWCYYDKELNILYDQFCHKINIDAKKYLTSIGLIDENDNVLKESDFY